MYPRQAPSLMECVVRTSPHLATALAATSILVLGACRGSTDLTNSPSPTPPPPVSPTFVPTSTTPVPPPPTPASPPPTSGVATATCRNGWVTPPTDSKQYLLPLRVIRRTTGISGPVVVVDMRYFTGPETPMSQMNYLKDIRRWYVKLYAKDEPAFQGRFLVEARRFGQGLSAVAPYLTHGWRSPNWIGFQWDSGDRVPKSYPGLPGQWQGIPYDFVKGGGGLTFPGLPPENAGCLAGT
jgi:hypothetical protein